MHQDRKSFPLVADGEPVSTEEAIMSLYDNEDLISNIHGVYHEKSYDDIVSNHRVVRPNQRQVQRHQKDIASGKSYARQARQQAKEDVKKKRQTYLTKDVTKTTGFELSKKVVSAPIRNKRQGDYAKYSGRLSQADYILAELPKVYKEPKNKLNLKSQKNNYDFLKTSQIYNPKNKQTFHEPAQELNLARFEG
ncbi:hypothetical protein [Streptococcus sciuri]|uniref:Cystathionine gamma-synthase n=1 Tax=Streptococcus sciuri TaxID=2973939 RepID=A0ABT2FAM2_9STRE|nr:hypothetical protein [Streptococcus sciuri]MCS4488850.1 hypothetical protein [Streptococcus sciuri]